MHSNYSIKSIYLFICIIIIRTTSMSTTLIIQTLAIVHLLSHLFVIIFGRNPPAQYPTKDVSIPSTNGRWTTEVSVALWLITPPLNSRAPGGRDETKSQHGVNTEHSAPTLVCLVGMTVGKDGSLMILGSVFGIEPGCQSTDCNHLVDIGDSHAGRRQPLACVAGLMSHASRWYKFIISSVNIWPGPGMAYWWTGETELVSWWSDRNLTKNIMNLTAVIRFHELHSVCFGARSWNVCKGKIECLHKMFRWKIQSRSFHDKSLWCGHFMVIYHNGQPCLQWVTSERSHAMTWRSVFQAASEFRHSFQQFLRINEAPNQQRSKMTTKLQEMNLCENLYTPLYRSFFGCSWLKYQVPFHSFWVSNPDERLEDKAVHHSIATAKAPQFSSFIGYLLIG